MTDWSVSFGFLPVKPADFDTTSSEKFVYQRRNFQRVSFESEFGSVVECWQYEERKLTHGEYEKLLEDTIAENSAAIDNIIISMLEG